MPRWRRASALEQGLQNSQPRRRDWLRWGIVVLLLASCALFVDFGDVASTLAGISIGWLVAIILVMTFDRLLMPWKWGILLRALALDVPLASRVRIYYQATVSGILLPTSVGGDLLRGHWIAQETGEAQKVFASILMEKGIGLLSAVGWALLGLAGLIVVHGGMPWLFVGAFMVASLVVAGAFALSVQAATHAFLRRQFNKLRQARAVEFLARLSEAYATYGERRTALLSNGVVTLFEQGVQILAVLMQASALGIDAWNLPFLCITAMHLLVYRIPIAPDGWGVGELSAIGFYGLIGVAPADAFALALLAHVVQTVVVLPGLWFLVASRSAPVRAAPHG